MLVKTGIKKLRSLTAIKTICAITAKPFSTVVIFIPVAGSLLRSLITQTLPNFYSSAGHNGKRYMQKAAVYNTWVTVYRIYHYPYAAPK